MAECTICGGTIDENNPPAQGNYGGEKQYFCSVEHKEEFEERNVQS